MEPMFEVVQGRDGEWWVDEYSSSTACGDCECIEHGPYRTFEDAEDAANDMEDPS